jgi:PadR family transcriptional regulator PadR
MADRLHLTYASAVILSAIAEGCTYGFQLIDDTGLPSGTVYPSLRRMEAAGLIQAVWDHDGAKKSGGPPRKHYSLTGDGRNHLEVLRGRYPRLMRAGKSK